MRQARLPGDEAKSQVILRVTPKLLVRIGGERYALIATEDNDLGSHADRGAISVAYLERHAARWSLVQRWDEFVWTGNTGRAVDEVISRKAPGAMRLAFALSHQMLQGAKSTSALVIDLASSGPKVLGEIPQAAERAPGDGCDQNICGSYAYKGAFGSPMVSRALFSVVYRGWEQPPRSAGKVSFIRTVNYEVRRGGLEGIPSTNLPN